MRISVTFHSLVSVAFAITVFAVSPPRPSFAGANSGGFSVDLIHRDSPLSPFYDPSVSPSDRVVGALRRSFHHRANRLVLKSCPSGDQKPAETDVISDHGEFLMRLSFGTPPLEVLAIADSGSDTIWIQCQPCSPCYKQVGPIFDPRASTTYKSLPCRSTQCDAFSGSSCSGASGTCRYNETYGDGSYSRGDVGNEVVKLGSKTLKNIVFGCGNSNGGIFSPTGSGIVGLGGGKASLISQMYSLIHGKFSYCFVPNPVLNGIATKSSKLNFGGVISGTGVVSTPLIQKSRQTYYYLTLKGVSVGNKRFNLNKSSNVANGNIIIDSGTTLTFLPSELYNGIESEVRIAIKLEAIPDPQNISKLCYPSSRLSNAPSITVHFKGADVTLNKVNTFVETSEDSMCLGFLPAEDIPPIYGNLAQMNFLVGYDLMKKKISFKPTDCTQQY